MVKFPTKAEDGSTTMTTSQRILVAAAIPPMLLPPASGLRSRRDNPLPRLGRLAWLLAAFSLPALGLTVADLVHRGGEPGTMQVVAPPSPSGGATISPDAIPASRLGMASPHDPSGAARG